MPLTIFDLSYIIKGIAKCFNIDFGRLYAIYADYTLTLTIFDHYSYICSLNQTF